MVCLITQTTEVSYEKAKSIFNLCNFYCYLKAVSYGYGGTGNDYDFRYYYSNWDVSYAEDMFY